MAPQNTFLENIVRRSSGESGGLGDRGGFGGCLGSPGPGLKLRDYVVILLCFVEHEPTVHRIVLQRWSSPPRIKVTSS